jgi:hypothetical protein
MKAFFSVALTAAMLTMAVPAWGQCVGCASSGPVFGSSYSSGTPVQYAQATYGGNYVGGYSVYQPATDFGYGTYTSDCGSGCGQVVQSGSFVGSSDSFDCGNQSWSNSCGQTARRSGLLAGRGRLINRSVRGNSCGQAAYTNISSGCNTGCGQVVSNTGCNTGCNTVCNTRGNRRNTGCGQVSYTSGCNTGCGQVVYSGGCGTGCGQVVYSSGCGDCASSTVVTGDAVAAPEVVSPPVADEPTPAIPTPDET